MRRAFDAMIWFAFSTVRYIAAIGCRDMLRSGVGFAIPLPGLYHEEIAV